MNTANETVGKPSKTGNVLLSHRLLAIFNELLVLVKKYEDGDAYLALGFIEDKTEAERKRLCSLDPLDREKEFFEYLDTHRTPYDMDLDYAIDAKKCPLFTQKKQIMSENQHPEYTMNYDMFMQSAYPYEALRDQGRDLAYPTIISSLILTVILWFLPAGLRSSGQYIVAISLWLGAAVSLLMPELLHWKFKREVRIRWKHLPRPLRKTANKYWRQLDYKIFAIVCSMEHISPDCVLCGAEKSLLIKWNRI